MTPPVLQVEGLRVELPGAGDDIVSDVSFAVAPGEVVGLVGESGSGKTTVATALLGYVRGGARIAAGRVLVDGTDLLSLSRRELSQRRGKLIAYVPQDPASALNPALRLGTQLREVIEVHGGAEIGPADERIREALAEVNLPGDRDFLRRYAHQLSGGQQQRICLAMAFLLRPPVVVLDEPTTGLDVTTEAQVLQTIRSLCTRHGVATLYVSHDLAVVGGLAHRVLVMYAGRVVEVGDAAQVFGRPAHPYTASLIAAIPDVRERRSLDGVPGHAPAPAARGAGCVFAPRCALQIDRCLVEAPEPTALQVGHEVRCHRAGERRPARAVDVGAGRVVGQDAAALLSVSGLAASYGSNRVLHDVSLALAPRACLALVGESGSGKTTLARVIVGLMTPDVGEVAFRGERLAGTARSRSQLARREIQYVFQSPLNSLNPRRTIGDIVAMPLRHFFALRGVACRQAVREALDRVELPATAEALYPDQLSGGERQRVAIARALVCRPELLICDEITSALDVSVQAVVLNLLAELRERERLSVLFVTHNLALVRSIADQVVVMRGGRVVESGNVDVVLDRPREAYTRELLAHTPSLPAGM